MIDASIQTILVNSTSVEVQTEKENSKGLINIINRSLHEMNNLIETENDPEMLKSLDKIVEVLRGRKYFWSLITPTSKKKAKPKRKDADF